MSYTVLAPPAGTLGYKPREKSFLEQLVEPVGEKFGKGLGAGFTGSIYKQAAAKEGLTPKYEVDSEGNVKTTYEKPTEKKSSKENIQSRLKLFMTGMGTPEEFGFKDQAEMDAARTDLEGKVKADAYLRKYFAYPEPEKPEKPEDEKRNFDVDIQKVIEGQSTWDDLRKRWGSKADDIDKIQSQHTPIQKSEKFKEGWGLTALKSPNVAKLNDGTKFALTKIKSEKDYSDLMADYAKDPQSFKDAGVDIKAIKEYFGRR